MPCEELYVVSCNKTLGELKEAIAAQMNLNFDRCNKTLGELKVGGVARGAVNLDGEVCCNKTLGELKA